MPRCHARQTLYTDQSMPLTCGAIYFDRSSTRPGNVKTFPHAGMGRLAVCGAAELHPASHGTSDVQCPALAVGAGDTPSYHLLRTGTCSCAEQRSCARKILSAKCRLRALAESQCRLASFAWSSSRREARAAPPQPRLLGAFSGLLLCMSRQTSTMMLGGQTHAFTS